MEDKELQHLIAASWRREAPSADRHARLAPILRELADDVPAEQPADDEAAEAASLARRAMTGHARMLLVSTLNGHRHTLAAPLVSAAWEQSRQAIAAFDRASPKARRSCLAVAQCHIPDPIRLVRMVNEMES